MPKLLRPGKPVIPPLSGENTCQLAAAAKSREHVRRGAPGVAQERGAHERPGDSLNRPGHGLGGPKESARSRATLNSVKVAVDCRPFRREVFLEPVAKTFRAARKLVFAAAQDDTIVDVRHGLPLKAPIRQVIEGGAYRRIRIVHLADVMNPDVPLVARPAEHVSETARRVMTLKHQNAMTGVAGEEGGCC